MSKLSAASAAGLLLQVLDPGFALLKCQLTADVVGAALAGTFAEALKPLALGLVPQEVGFVLRLDDVRRVLGRLLIRVVQAVVNHRVVGLVHVDALVLLNGRKVGIAVWADLVVLAVVLIATKRLGIRNGSPSSHRRSTPSSRSPHGSYAT